MLPTKPPRNDDGEVTPHNHQDIVNNDTLVRGISPLHLVDGATPGEKRLSTMAFSASSGPNEGLSCVLQRLLNDDEVTSQAWLEANPAYVGGVALSVQAVRALPVLVGYDPIDPPNANPYHCQIWSLNPFPDLLKRNLLGMSTWVLKPANVA